MHDNRLLHLTAVSLAGTLFVLVCSFPGRHIMIVAIPIQKVLIIQIWSVVRGVDLAEIGRILFL